MIAAHARSNFGQSSYVVWTDYPPGEHRITCAECGRGDRDRTLGLTVNADGNGVAHCFRCGAVETWRDARACRPRKVEPGSTFSTRRHGKAPPGLVAPRKRSSLSEYGQDLWNACTGLRGTVGESYLRERHCAIPPTEGDLRYCADLRHPSGYRGPGLVALVTDAVTRRPLTLHRTWVLADGRKAPVEPARLLLGGHRKQGGVIRLWPDEDVSIALGIAEGIETALTLATAFQPVWSLIDAGNLAAFPALPGIGALTIAADNDPAGLQAAERCATVWTEAGKEVRLVVPPRARTDLNDVAQEAAGA